MREYSADCDADLSCALALWGNRHAVAGPYFSSACPLLMYRDHCIA